MPRPPKTTRAKHGTGEKGPEPATIGAILEYLSPGLHRTGCPLRPPDAFALAAVLLQKSGAYSFVSEQWPPSPHWVKQMRKVGHGWRRSWAGKQALPAEVREWWHIVVTHRTVELAALRRYPALCRALLQLCAAADEASAGIGLAPDKRQPRTRSRTARADRRITDIIQQEAYDCLGPRDKTGATLCKSIHPSKVRVLPKLHTPQNGLTIRSLSRSLALCTAEEIRTEWIRAFGFLKNRAGDKRPDNSLNLLIVPWPEIVKPFQFQAAGPSSGAFGRFTYKPEHGIDAHPNIENILRRAVELAGPIHGVVLPELSLTEEQFEKIVAPVLEQGAFLIGGVVKESPGGNCLRFCHPISPEHYIERDQSKHHRWKLDKSQIIQYGLGSTLHPEKLWWEDIPLQDRSLMFVSIYHWLTMSMLICEDLARPDPVGDLVRAVGPNLVVALLMDGPQLASRWPGRYATVLADDPGCSVLSLTSLGMVELSRPPYVQARSRVVALWKDAKGGMPVEIELPKDADAVILNLTVQYIEEYTADGRSDQCTTGYPILAGVHPVLRSR